MSAPQPLAAPGLAAQDGVAHGFFTREGGVSRGVYESLNCGPGSGDDPEAVAANRAAAAASLGAGAAPLATAHQVHGARAVRLDAPPQRPPRADALVAAAPGLVVGVLTADCAPVLLADAEAGVVAAAHAGWRGAAAGILEATVAAMVACGAAPPRIRAAIGPCIGPESYEVAGDMRAEVLRRDPDARGRFRAAARPGRWLFDLPGYAADRLAAAGAGRIEATGGDTLADERFFSYRRARRRGAADYGRCLSAIALAPARRRGRE